MIQVTNRNVCVQLNMLKLSLDNVFQIRSFKYFSYINYTLARIENYLLPTYTTVTTYVMNSLLLKIIKV